MLDRLRCPVTGGTVREALEEERQVLQPLPSSAELFDVEVARRVSRDCLVSFEGRRYSVPFAWAGQWVDVRGTARDVVVRGGGQEIARHRRGTRALLLLKEAHYEGCFDGSGGAPDAPGAAGPATSGGSVGELGAGG